MRRCASSITAIVPHISYTQIVNVFCRPGWDQTHTRPIFKNNLMDFLGCFINSGAHSFNYLGNDECNNMIP